MVSQSEFIEHVELCQYHQTQPSVLTLGRDTDPENWKIKGETKLIFAKNSIKQIIAHYFWDVYTFMGRIKFMGRMAKVGPTFFKLAN